MARQPRARSDSRPSRAQGRGLRFWFPRYASPKKLQATSTSIALATPEVISAIPGMYIPGAAYFASIGQLTIDLQAQLD